MNKIEEARDEALSEALKHPLLGAWRLSQSVEVRAGSSVVMHNGQPTLEAWDVNLTLRPAPDLEEIDAWGASQVEAQAREELMRLDREAAAAKLEQAARQEREAAVARRRAELNDLQTAIEGATTVAKCRDVMNRMFALFEDRIGG